jgi:Fe2+ transport system protein FeoA
VPTLDTSTIPEEILPGASVRIRGEAAPGATVRVAVDDRVVASAVAGESGAFRATVGFAQPGTYTVTLQLIGEDDQVLAVSEPVAVNVLAPTPTATDTPRPTATPTATNTPEPTSTPTNTPAPTATPTATPEPTATDTPVPSPTPTLTNTPLPTATATPVPTDTATPEPTATPTDTPEPTATATETPEPTATATPLPEPVEPVLDLDTVPAEILPGESVRLFGEAAPGATIRVLVNGREVGSAVAGETGRFRTTVGFPQAGDYAVTLEVVDQDGNVVVSSAPVTLTIVEPTPTAVATELVPTVTPTEEPTIAPPLEITATVVTTETVAVPPVQPAELPGTGVSIDRLGAYNLLIPLALIAGLICVTIFQRQRR